MNCRGLGDKVKRADVFNYMRERKYSIICLQDIHVDPEREGAIVAEWGAEAIVCGLKSNARGVGIFFNTNFEYSLKKVKKAVNKGYIIVEIEIGGRTFLLITLYGLNEDRPLFYQTLAQDIADFDNGSMILCGDWNLVLDQEKDTENYLRVNNPNAKQIVANMMSDYSLFDVWREQHGELRQYTYKQYNPSKQSRLDFFLISEDLLGLITDSQIRSGYRTDHSLTTVNFQIAKYQRGNGYWKFNAALLKDPDYVKLVRTTLWETIELYAALPYNRQNLRGIPLETLQFVVTDQLFLETLLMIIRGKTIAFSSWKKKESMKREKELEETISQIEERLHQSIANIDDNVLQTLKNTQKELETLREIKAKGTILRSKVCQLEAGERPSKYFLTLETRNYTSKLITKVVLDTGEEVYKLADIIQHQKNFYQTLYAERTGAASTNIRQTLISLTGPKLTREVSNELEGEIKLREMSQALKFMKNEKSPGLDGFTVEFFKFFWQDLKYFVLRSVNQAIDTGTLSISLRRGVISCIPKPGKPRFFLKNWRPISLLSVIYKIASSCIANRIKTVLDQLIHADQKGFIKGRFIGENIRQMYDILYETRRQRIPGLLMLIDFEKAFDSVSWNFIRSSLAFFNFGPSLCKWVDILYCQSESCIIQNGHLSDFFRLGRGCRQGDPLSPYLFLLCGEILALMIRSNQHIGGVQIWGNTFKLSQYADDTTLYLDGKESSLREVINTLQKFYDVSGLKMNTEKTKLIWFGASEGSNASFCGDANFEWGTREFNTLGVNFNSNVKNIWSLNMDKKMLEIQRLLTRWKKRDMSILGKITVIKSLALSKVVHLLIALPDPPEIFTQTLTKEFYNFIWNGGPDRVKREILTESYEKGGLKMINIQHFTAALKLTWIKRFVTKPDAWSEPLRHLSDSDRSLWNLGPMSQKLVENPFWSDVLKAWDFFRQKTTVKETVDVINEPIWYNPKCNTNELCINHWLRKGVCHIRDLFNERGELLTFVQFKEKFQVRGTILDYEMLLHCIPKKWLEVTSRGSYYMKTPRIERSLKLVLSCGKGTRRLCDILNNVDRVIPAQEKWGTELVQHNVYLSPEHWKQLYKLPWYCTKDNKLRSMQYKISQRFLITNRTLFHMGLTDNDLCSFCSTEKETIVHLFVECRMIKSFWNSLQSWLTEHIGCTIELSASEILFGKIGTSYTMINCLILLTKLYIYRTRLSGRVINVQAAVATFADCYKTEKFLSKVQNKTDFFFRKWAPLHNVLSGPHSE